MHIPIKKKSLGT